MSNITKSVKKFILSGDSTKIGQVCIGLKKFYLFSISGVYIEYKSILNNLFRYSDIVSKIPWILLVYHRFYIGADEVFHNFNEKFKYTITYKDFRDAMFTHLMYISNKFRVND